MKYSKKFFLLVMLGVTLAGCMKYKVNTTDLLLNYGYGEELKSIIGLGNHIKQELNINKNQISGGISSEEAFEIIVNDYAPTYKYNGMPNGEISYEMYNSVEGIEEPAYLFGFTNMETNDEYIGWVYGDGDYMMRMIFE